jgi:5-formyltetrahydrofolate cyclo-ligase
MTHPASVTEAKARAREEARRRRTGLDPQTRGAASAAIAERAIALIARLGPATLAAYVAVRDEADSRAILAWADQAGIVAALPTVADGARLVFRRFRPHDALAPAAFGIPAPAGAAEEVVPDLLVVPMLAFDRAGARLGYGRGFYDRAIAHLRNHRVDPRLVGVAFAVQEVAAVPSEAHDARMDFIVTENETIDLTVGRAKG